MDNNSSYLPGYETEMHSKDDLNYVCKQGKTDSNGRAYGFKDTVYAAS